jgi:hypothetical protein
VRWPTSKINHGAVRGVPMAHCRSQRASHGPSIRRLGPDISLWRWPVAVCLAWPCSGPVSRGGDTRPARGGACARARARRTRPVRWHMLTSRKVKGGVGLDEHSARCVVRSDQSVSQRCGFRRLACAISGAAAVPFFRETARPHHASPMPHGTRAVPNGHGAAHPAQPAVWAISVQGPAARPPLHARRLETCTAPTPAAPNGHCAIAAAGRLVRPRPLRRSTGDPAMPRRCAGAAAANPPRGTPVSQPPGGSRDSRA